MSNQPRYVELVTEAVRSIGGVVTNQQIKDWVLERRPDANSTTINCTILLCSVNVNSRVNYPENQKVRVKRRPDYDTLFKVGRGEYILYDPNQHGNWGIIRGDDDKFRVIMVNGAKRDTDKQVPTPEDLREAIRNAEWQLGSYIARSGSIDDAYVTSQKRLIDRYTMDLNDLEGASRSTLTPFEKERLMEMFDLGKRQLWADLHSVAGDEHDQPDHELIQQCEEREQDFWNLIKRIRS